MDCVNMRANLHFRELEELHTIIATTALEPVFQPILELGSGEIFGYEGLIRGPAAGSLHSPARLFAAATRAGALTDIEMISCRRVIKRYSRLDCDRSLFLNMSPQTVLEVREDSQRIAEFIRSCGLRLEQVTIELTEHNHVSDKAAFRQALVLFRSLGFRVGIDDLGEGFSSLRLWSELHPDFVKIDMHFVQGISQDPLKFQFLKSLQQIAENCNTALVAEGVESYEDLRLLRDLGISYAQGFLIAAPSAQPAVKIAPMLRDVLGSKTISIYPEAKIVANRTVTVEKLLVKLPTANPATVNDEVLRLFETSAELDAIPVVDDGNPVGLVMRQGFIELFVRPYYRELHGRKPCTMYMEPHPLVVDRDVTIQQLSETLVESDQRYLSQGFIIIDEGQYLGFGRSRDLIREVTRLQMEAARYANPLTMLPGNVPINEHIERLLDAGTAFSAAYCDLNHFKAFNDAYGYSLGDEMIKLTSKVLNDACDLNRDFLGHIGGDDFIILLQSDDAEARCERALLAFDRHAATLFRPDDVMRGSMRAEDRRGHEILFPLTSLAIGIVVVKPEHFASHLQVAAAATEAKKLAKRQNGSSLWIERRNPPIQNQLAL
jgi:EAL domain-containing protein (putative c-di-GMP-specific phosphodiesterase class I)/GGDEF domain-containing protein